MIFSIGEVLFDCYKEKGETKFLLGGAPFNVVYDVRKLGGVSYFVSAIGTKDHLEMEELIKEKTSNVYLFKSNSFNTRALVTLENGEREFSFSDMLPPLIEVIASRSRILLNPVSTS